MYGEEKKRERIVQVNNKKKRKRESKKDKQRERKQIPRIDWFDMRVPWKRWGSTGASQPGATGSPRIRL